MTTPHSNGWVLVPARPTPEMVAAYLAANSAYWKEIDEGPTPIGKWRNGTPAQATAKGYASMLAAAPVAPAPDYMKSCTTCSGCRKQGEHPDNGASCIWYQRERG